MKDVLAEDLAAASILESVHEVADFIRLNGTWEGGTKELTREAKIDGVSPVIFGKYLAQHSMFLEKNGVRYSKVHLFWNAGDPGAYQPDDGMTPVTAIIRAAYSFHSRHCCHPYGEITGWLSARRIQAAALIMLPDGHELILSP